MSFIIYILSIV